MRIVRFKSPVGASYGVVEDEVVYSLQGDVFSAWSAGGRVSTLPDLELLPPCQPSKIVAISKNYVDLARETQSLVPEEPCIFLKPPSALIAHLEPIVYPPISQRVDHEGELAVVIGRRCRSVSPAEAGHYVLGFTCANDVTARDLQRRDVQLTRAKGFDTFCPLGPFISTQLDVASATLQVRVNGQIRQSTGLREMVFGVEFLISFISQIMTLLPGDVILTGTPAGISPLQPGDVVEVEITGIGTLRNHIVAGRH